MQCISISITGSTMPEWNEIYSLRPIILVVVSATPFPFLFVTQISHGKGLA